jgi:hypothetical protein
MQESIIISKIPFDLITGYVEFLYGAENLHWKKCIDWIYDE